MNNYKYLLSKHKYDFEDEYLLKEGGDENKEEIEK